MSTQEFYDACQRFDWFYEMSDDHSVWQRGKQAEGAILAHAPEGSPNRVMWNAWVKHYYSGEPWNTVKAPKPERPQ